MKFLKWFAIAIIILTAIFFLGPKPADPKLTTEIPSINATPENLEAQIMDMEKQVNVKPNNQARIIWADSTKQKTPISIVYLHGFSASQEEGAPVHLDFAKRYGCNLYLSRLSQHGLQAKEPMLLLTPENLVESAKEAIAIGKMIGDKVLIMATSTGGTLALYLASGNPDIMGLILYSPNIDLYDSRSFILTQPWGLQLAELINGSKYYHFNGPPEVEKYWTITYRIEALISLKSLLNHTMTTETFSKIKQPVFVGYYEQDDQVSIGRMMEMFDQLQTPEKMKRKISFPKSGNHCLPSQIWSKDVEGVRNETFKFAEEVLRMSSVEK